MTAHRCKWSYAAAAIAVVAAGLVLFLFNPEESGLFPRCPFLMLTGYECPGCGSQRAIHALLHGNLCAAWGYNPLLVISLPYIIVGLMAEMSFRRVPFMCAVRRHLYSGRAVWVVLVVIVAYWIGRNII